jgi:hypothetical protein
MRWLTPLGIASVTILGVVSASTPAHAVMSCVSGPPVCRAAPGAKVCSLDASTQCNVNADCAPSGGTCVAGALAIGGTVTANPSNIVSIVFLGTPTNLTLTASVPPTAAFATFRVVPTTPGVDADGTVVATAVGGMTCTVPVTFRNRTGPGAPSNEAVCPLAEGSSVTVVSGPSSPAGTTACSSQLATCSDGAAVGTEFVTGSRIVSIRSPIASLGVPDVVMDFNKDGVCDNTRRLLFSRSADGGVSFTPFANITSSTTTPGCPFAAPPDGKLAPTAALTTIRGTGQWSDVKLADAVPAAGGGSAVPAMSDWMKFLLGSVILGIGAYLLRRNLS